MKALTLHQPFASLIAEGAKCHETRTWPPPRSLHGHRIAIHAAKHVGVLLNLQIVRGLQLNADRLRDLPQGAVVATAELLDAGQVLGVGYGPGTVLVRQSDGREEELFAEPYGWYGEDRWIWQLGNVEKLPEPIFVRGWQGLWEWHR